MSVLYGSICGARGGESGGRSRDLTIRFIGPFLQFQFPQPHSRSVGLPPLSAVSKVRHVGNVTFDPSCSTTARMLSTANAEVIGIGPNVTQPTF